MRHAAASINCSWGRASNPFFGTAVLPESEGLNGADGFRHLFKLIGLNRVSQNFQSLPQLGEQRAEFSTFN